MSKRILTILMAIACVVWGTTLHAQTAADAMPAASAAKAKGMLQQSIAALGGAAYLNVRNSDCSGRMAQFEHSGEVGGYIVFRNYKEMPDKNRMEYDPKAVIVTLYSGNQGWSLDRGGVTEIPAKDMADYQEQLKTDVNYILRSRMDDPTLIFRYDSSEVVDLKVSDWIAITDRDGHTIRIAMDESTHLPVRVSVLNRDEDGQKVDRTTAYANYHSIDGIQTPYQVARFRNGQQFYQVFYDNCKYNQPLSEDLFTRAGLDAHFAKIRKK